MSNADDNLTKHFQPETPGSTAGPLGTQHTPSSGKTRHAVLRDTCTLARCAQAECHMALRSRQTERNAGKWLLECESEHVRANVLQGRKLSRKPQTPCFNGCLPVLTSSSGQSLSSFSCTHAAAQSCSCWPPPCLNSRKCPSVLCSYMLPPCKHVARKPAARAKHVERYGVCTRWGAEKTQHVSEQVFPNRKYVQAR